MRKALLLLATMLPLLVAAQGWPASYGGVVLVVDNDTQLNDVKTNLSTYSNWFDLIFLGKDCSTMSSTDVQAFKAVNVGIVGYMETLNQATAKSMLDAGYVGYRYHTSGASKANAETTRDINAALNATFVVGDMYSNSTDTNVLKQWLKFNYKDGNYQAAVCDNSLKLSSFNHSVYRFADVNDQGLLADFIAKRYAINYVPTELPGEEARRAAYAFIFTMPGTPIVFKADWDNTTHYQTLIQYLIRARHAAGITNQAAIYGGNEGGPEFETDGENNGNTKGVSWRVMGNKGAMYLQLGWKYVRDGSVPSGFTQVYKAHNNEEFRVSISNGVALTNYIAMASDHSKIRGGDSDPLGYPIIDKNSGHYNGTLAVTIKPNNNFTTLVFTTDGNNPTAQSEKIRGERTINLTKTTTLKVAVLESDGKTVKINSMVARQYVIDTNAVSDVTIYAKRGDQSTDAPWIRVEGTNSDVPMTNKRSIGGIEWFYYTISGSGTKRFILKESNGGKQTPWLTADRDAFYAFCDHPQAGYNSNVACYAFDETNTYMVDYYDPKVSIDKASGDYKNWVQPTVSATYKDATIVYTTDNSEPSSTNGTRVTGPKKIIDNVFKYAGEDKSVTLRAGVLYNDQVINLVARTYHIKAPEEQYPGASENIDNTGINIFVKRADGSSPIYAHVWGGASRNLEESDALNDIKNVKGETWYYLHYDTNDAINIIFATDNSWGHQTQNIEGLGTGNHFFVYNQSANANAEKPTDQASTYDEWVNNPYGNSVDPGNAIPSCATYVPSKQFFYFENNKPYVSPHAWIFNGYTPISSDCWPGSAFIEPIGTSPEGYAIYRWTWDEGNGDLTAQMNFNDQGGNVVDTSQTNSYNFENSGYYDVNGERGKVSASYVTLAEAIRYATETQQYYITDDLYVGHISKDGQYIYAKDARGSALNPFYPSAGFTLDEDKDDDAYAYDQSNWVEIKLPAEKWIPKADRNRYIGKTIAGGTLYGTFRSRNNPQIEIATGGMLPVFNTGGYNVTLTPFNNEIARKAFLYNSFRDDSDNGMGDLNLYHTGNFLTSVGDRDDRDNTDDPEPINERFYVNPKILEVAAIRWAVYQDGKFYAPSQNNSAAGCIEIENNLSSDASWWEGGITLQDGKVYLLKGIVINKGDKYLFHKDDRHHNAPRRVGIVSAEPGDRYKIRLIDAYTDDNITGVNDVNINKTIESVRYINLMGAESSRAFDGVNIVVTKYSDGTTSTTKVVF